MRGHGAKDANAWKGMVAIWTHRFHVAAVHGLHHSLVEDTRFAVVEKASVSGRVLRLRDVLSGTVSDFGHMDTVRLDSKREVDVDKLAGILRAAGSNSFDTAAEATSIARAALRTADEVQS